MVILQQGASEESESDEEIEFHNNLDAVYENLTDDEDLFWYAYIYIYFGKNMFQMFCFLIKHIFFLHCSVLLNTKNVIKILK